MTTYAKRFNAQRAAKSAIGKDAKEGVEFATEKNKDGEWIWLSLAAVDLPKPPDFSAKTHTRFRPKLAAVIAMAEARDLEGLRQFHMNPTSTSPKAIMRYRDRVIDALTQ